ncbi:MT-A70-domain-containing protein [Scheffersomyces coipomensis]|uniref:MT-A70-domain-containing protein n=1 Tax=Scheffersomyces coipomensis TaxID=1788519 RepID=UPI00315CABD5
MQFDEANVFLPFAEFLLRIHEDLLIQPLRGDLCKTMVLFNKYLNDIDSGIQYKLEEFFQYIILFNEVSGNALRLDRSIECNKEITTILEMPRLVWINLAALSILKDRLLGNPFQGIAFKAKRVRHHKNDQDHLLDLLDKPILTRIEAEVTSSLSGSNFHCDYLTLDTLLRKPNSRSILAKEKIRLKVLEKPFYEVCNDSNHNQMLTSFCFNKKEHGNQSLTKQNFPDVSIIHQKLNQYKNLMPQDIFECSQTKTHYLPIINSHTDYYLGDCSYLDTCHKMKTCRYLHYYSLAPLSNLDIVDQQQLEKCKNHEYTLGECFTEYQRQIVPPHWINCDVRYLPFQVLGKFAAIISDPAWDIHMSLPYGTCKDDELLSLPMHELQDEGIILLWVTGRSIEIGRRALLKWGYSISDEMIWVKLNQLRRTIVTGRTGHWLNHSKEHLLVGIKGDPIWLNRKMDADVVVSSTRETSRKPDEIYDVVERMVGVHSRKLEIFGRDHNTRPGWLTIGNQLQGTNIEEDEVKSRFETYLKNHK